MNPLVMGSQSRGVGFITSDSPQMTLESFVRMKYFFDTVKQGFKQRVLDLIEACSCRSFPCRLEAFNKYKIHFEWYLSGKFSRDGSMQRYMSGPTREKQTVNATHF
jgi:hypothetical protein